MVTVESEIHEGGSTPGLPTTRKHTPNIEKKKKNWGLKRKTTKIEGKAKDRKFT